MTDDSDSTGLDFERISLLYSNTNLGYLGSGVASLAIAFIIQELSSPGIALLWILAVFLSYTPRIILSILFSRKIAAREIKQENVRPWEQYFFLGSILPFFCFSAAVFLPYGDNSGQAILFLTAIVMTLMAGGTLTYSTSLSTIKLYMVVTLMPVIAKCFLMQEVLFTVLGLTLCFAFLIITSLTFKQHKLLVQNIALKIENEHRSLTDPLTKLWNRRRLDLFIETLIPASRRRGGPFSVILIDIDRFKRYNDKRGHGRGDELLISLSNILLECSRDQDLVVRYGGEEFLLVLPSTNIENAKFLTERIRTAVKQRTDVTISAGLAMHSDPMDFEHLMNLADMGLYIAKKEGRDQYAIADEALEAAGRAAIDD